MNQAKLRKVEKGAPFLRPTKLSRDSFKGFIEQRGWRMADVACRWSIRPEHLSRIAADEARDSKWDDLVRSLPTLSAFERSCVTAARLYLIPPKPRQRKNQPISQPDQVTAAEATGVAVQPNQSFNWEHGEEEDEAFAPGVDGFRYNSYLSRGSELVVIQEIEDFARENAILVVTATRVGVDTAGGVLEEYQCESATGDRRWIAPDQIDDWLVSNGKMRDLR